MEFRDVVSLLCVRVILNLGLPSFLLNTVLSLCCTKKSTNTVVANTVTTAAHTEDEHSTKNNLALVKSNKQQFYRSTSTLETQTPTIAKQLSTPRLQN